MGSRKSPFLRMRRRSADWVGRVRRRGRGGVSERSTRARTFSRAAFDCLKDFIAARTSVAIGPGLSTHPETVELVQALVRQLDRPSVLDADALNALAGKSSLLTECKRPPIITPHPGEMARLETEATTQSVNEDRLGTAARFARERGVFVILKGARTVIARAVPSARIRRSLTWLSHCE